FRKFGVKVPISDGVSPTTNSTMVLFILPLPKTLAPVCRRTYKNTSIQRTPVIVAMPLLDQKTPAALLRTWIGRQASAESLAWLDAALAETDPRDPGKLAAALAMAGRKLGNAQLLPSRDELADADRLRAGW